MEPNTPLATQPLAQDATVEDRRRVESRTKDAYNHQVYTPNHDRRLMKWSSEVYANSAAGKILGLPAVQSIPSRWMLFSDAMGTGSS